ncbi:MAG TPA: zf-HC2 domain-containing protein [Gemmatimonadaceae bacterium]
MSTGPHLGSEEVAAYLDNTLSDAECARVKAHLADCGVCREEVVSVSKLLDRAPRSRSRVITFSGVAAAAVLAFLLLRPSPDSGLPTRVAVRGPDTPLAAEGVSGVRAIAPMGRQTTGDNILFVWHLPSPGATYRFTLTDERGNKIWVGSTNDTTLVVPKEFTPASKQSYNWFVDALLPDGSSITTGITSFQIVR